MSIIKNKKINNSIYQSTHQQQRRIEVAIRMRPLLKGLQDEQVWKASQQQRKIISLPRKVQSKNRSLNSALQTANSYEFTSDYIFDQHSQNQQVYQQCSSKLIHNMFQFESNGTVFMYGQTTSGKTYTMLGNEKSAGIIMFSLIDIFQRIEKNNKQSLKVLGVVISYLQIYNEQVNDLLNPKSSGNLKIIDSNVPNLTQFQASSYQEAIDILLEGQQQRVYKQKDIHDHSSRSHTIFQIKIVEKSDKDFDNSAFNKNQRKSKIKGVLNLVDLAGSQRLQDDDSNQQTGYINKSLFVLSNVIHRLASSKKKQNQVNGNNVHIPFRDSKLTRLLAPSLLGNSQTIVICTISPASVNYNQTLSTLRFAGKSRKVQFKALSNISSQNQSKISYFSNQSVLNQSSILSNLPISMKKQKQIFSNNNEIKIIESLRQQNSILRKNLTFLQEQQISSYMGQQSFLQNKSKNISQMINNFKTKYLLLNKENNNSQQNFRRKQNWYKKVNTLCDQYKRNIQLMQKEYFKALINITSVEYGIQRNLLHDDLMKFQNDPLVNNESFIQISSIKHQN